MTDSLGLGLQSGIVVAVLIAALFLADRLGGEEGLGRKVSQVVVALAILLTVFAGTAAFLRPPDAPEGDFFASSDSQEDQEELEDFLQDVAERKSEAGTIHLGLGIALAAVGGVLLTSMRAIPGALLLAGTLLLLLGTGPQSGSSSFDSFSALYAPLLSYATDAGQARDIIRLVVLLAGTVLMFFFIAWRWEVPPPKGAPTSLPPAEPAEGITAGP